LRQFPPKSYSKSTRQVSGAAGYWTSGCRHGVRTSKHASAARAQPAGIDVFAEMVASARALGVDVAEIDLKRQSFRFVAGVGEEHTTYTEGVRLDEYYVRNWSVWLDFHILAKRPRW
jgi:hypothetical protein